MDSSGEGGPRLEADLADLAAEFRHGDGSDRWRCWPGIANNGLVYAWRLLSSPPVVLRDHTVGGLRKRMAKFETALAGDPEHDIDPVRPSEALAQAERLET